jgi:hypothetical protein
MKIVKKMLMVAAGAAALVATPASAGTQHWYFAWNGQIWEPVGEAVYNDCGVLIYSTGGTSEHYSTQYYSIPC